MNKRIIKKKLKCERQQILNSLFNGDILNKCCCDNSRKPSYQGGNNMHFYNLVLEVVNSCGDYKSFVHEESSKILNSNLCPSCKKNHIESLEKAYAYFNEGI